MKSFRVLSTDIIDKDGNKRYKHLKDYFGCKVYFDLDNIIVLRGCHNYYDPIKLKECIESEAHFHFVSYKDRISCFYKFVDRENYEERDKMAIKKDASKLI